MGGEGSKNGDKSGLLNLSSEEKKCVQQIYRIISHNHEMQNGFSKAQFQTYTSQHNLDQHLSSELYDVMLHSGNTGSQSATLVSFESLLSQLLKGSFTEKATILRRLSTKNQEPTGTEIYRCISSLLKSYMKVITSSIQFKTWACHSTQEACDRLTLYLLQDLFKLDFKQQTTDDSRSCIPDSISYSEFSLEDWLVKSPITQHVFDLTFHSVFPLNVDASKVLKPMIPVVTETNWAKFNTILDLADIIYLNHTVPTNLQSEWRLLFSNCLYGDSFTQLVSHIVKKGPNLLVIRDKDGHVFGGFVNENWEIKSQFSGSSNCYLFTVQPHFGMYTATGYNDNFVYLNKSVQTLPNGLGLGGQFDYFGLWIDQSFNNGHSKAVPKCTTYGSPQLSAKPEFEVDIIEVWGVGPNPQLVDSDDEGDSENFKKKSILDKDPESKAILELMGKVQVSEGLREPEEEEMTEEMKKRHNMIQKLI